jgi:hypothetical protein
MGLGAARRAADSWPPAHRLTSGQLCGRRHGRPASPPPSPCSGASPARTPRPGASLLPAAATNTMPARPAWSSACDSAALQRSRAPQELEVAAMFMLSSTLRALKYSIACRVSE